MSSATPAVRDLDLTSLRLFVAVCESRNIAREIVDPVAASFGFAVIPLTDRWAIRRFAIRFRSLTHLSPSARLLVAHLERLAATA